LPAGGNFNGNSVGATGRYSDFSFQPQLSLKAGVFNENKTGIGLFYEAARFTVENGIDAYSLGILAYSAGGKNAVNIANRQHTIGLEFYQKVAVNQRSYLRFGALLGYALANRSENSQRGIATTSGGFSLGGGLDMTLQFPLAGRLNGLVNSGFRYHRVLYEAGNTIFRISTVSFPITTGVSYIFSKASVRNKLEPAGF
jgi:hypothetical protein